MKKSKARNWEKEYSRIKDLPGLDEHEKVLFAKTLAASPDERWARNVSILKSLGLWGRLGLKKFGSN